MLKDTQHKVYGSVRVVECTEACVSLKYFPDGSGAAWFRCAEGVPRRGGRVHARKVEKPSLGVFVDERNFVTDGFKRAVGSPRAVGRVITGVEQKKKFKGEEQLGSLVKDCVAKVEDELQKRDREIQMVTEAGEVGKDLYQQTVMEDRGEMDKNQVMENNESFGGPVLENPFEEVDGQIRWAVHEGEQGPGSRTLEPGRDRGPVGTSKEAHKVRKQGKFG